MLALERRNLILEKLQNEKRVVVSELSQLYGVSEETIRRDLDKLEKEGLAIKSYGGAVINEDVSIDLPFNVRKNQNVVGKQKMAEIVASLVHDGGTSASGRQHYCSVCGKGIKREGASDCDHQFHGDPSGTGRCVRMEYYFHRWDDEGRLSGFPWIPDRRSHSLLFCRYRYFFL